MDYYSGGAQSLAQLTMEQFFAIEPFRSLREYFDVYHKKMLKGFSVIPTDEEHELASSGGVFSLTVYISQDGCDSGTTNPHAHGTYRKPGGGFKTASYSGEICMMHPREITLSINDSTGFDDYLIRNSTLHHELGHAIGSLLDQYKKRYGNAPNVSISGDPEQVPWNRFFSISRYDGRVGIYELFPDCFFPSPNSLMGADSESYYEAYYFDSPSRYSIFENILQMSNQTDDFKWTLDEGDVWNAFLEYDVINDAIPY